MRLAIAFASVLCAPTYNSCMRRCLRLLLPILLLLFGHVSAHGDAPAFDLIGPKIDVHVQRNGRTLPIAEVPLLEPGDRLWIHPDLPQSQSARYVLIVAFLRGATNPPPLDWFHRVETWTREARQEGVFVVVPPEAQHALLFLAPETNGDFSTLRAAVRGRPGAFVRSAQDLQQASWDRMRLNAYLAEVKTVAGADPKNLKSSSELAARTLGMRLDQQCFDKPTEQQAPCLVQHTDGLVLDDSSAQSRVTQIANGSTADLMNQLSYSTAAGAGMYSPYVGAIVDVVRIFSGMHTAKYQYIPALALPFNDPGERAENQGETLNLRLNVPPSFRDPKSVIVIALPPIVTPDAIASRLPQIHPPDPALSFCALKPDLVLPAEGAPLMFATSMAFGLKLHIVSDGGDQAHAPASFDVPIHPSAIRGGFVLEKPLPLLEASQVTGQLRGSWGFDSWVGPKFTLMMPRHNGWTAAEADHNALITGRQDTLHLVGANTVCVESVVMQLPDQSAIPIVWRSARPRELELPLPLHDASPGPVTVLVQQFGMAQPEKLTLQAYAEAAALDSFNLNAGDKLAVLKGNRLDEVRSVDLAGITFAPDALHRVLNLDQLLLNATGVTATLQPGSNYQAHVTLRDGRQLQVSATVAPPRPAIDLLSKGEQHQQNDYPDVVRLGSPNDLALERKIVLFVRSRVPASFPRKETLELAAVDGSFQTTLSLADGSLMLEDAHTAVAVLDPLARFGPSAFGPMQLRALSPDGVAGDWVPIGTLVRIPQFTDMHCFRSTSRPCTLSGNNLFLVTAICNNPDMSDALDVPPEFAGTELTLPSVVRNGNTGTVYLRLRDDPQTVQALNMNVTLLPTPPAQPAKRTPNAAVDREPAPEHTANPTAGTAQEATPPAENQSTDTPKEAPAAKPADTGATPPATQNPQS